jgi:hypothetical protein
VTTPASPRLSQMISTWSSIRTSSMPSAA